MKVKVILVEPEYEGNIGFIARAMLNFGLKELILVNPKANHRSGKAKSRAMRAKHLLQKAKVVGSLKEALKDVDVAVATTAKIGKGKKLNRTGISVREFAENFSKSSSSIGLVFGPERNGLTNEQINECDFLVSIPASGKYKTLNLSHAGAILFYELFQSEKGRKGKNAKTINKKLKKNLVRQFNELIYSGKKIRNKPGTLNSFKALISRAPATEPEAKAIMAVFGSVLKKIKKVNN